MKWYSRDFGKDKVTLLNFILKHLNNKYLKSKLKDILTTDFKLSNLKINYKSYNWDVVESI